jgi:hypothetical protein
MDSIGKRKKILSIENLKMSMLEISQFNTKVKLVGGVWQSILVGY